MRPQLSALAIEQIDGILSLMSVANLNGIHFAYFIALQSLGIEDILAHSRYAPGWLLD